MAPERVNFDQKQQPLARRGCLAYELCSYRVGAAGEGSGAGGCCAGAGAGAVFVGDDVVPDKTDPVLVPRRLAKMESVMEVSMNTMAAQVVALLSTVAAVRVPNAVWLPMPPKAAAISALLPLCNRTTAIRKTQTMT